MNKPRIILHCYVDQLGRLLYAGEVRCGTRLLRTMFYPSTLEIYSIVRREFP